MTEYLLRHWKLLKTLGLNADGFEHVLLRTLQLRLRVVGTFLDAADTPGTGAQSRRRMETRRARDDSHDSSAWPIKTRSCRVNVRNDHVECRPSGEMRGSSPGSVQVCGRRSRGE